MTARTSRKVSFRSNPLLIEKTSRSFPLSSRTCTWAPPCQTKRTPRVFVSHDKLGAVE